MSIDKLFDGFFDFVDFGCSTGDSLKFGFDSFGTKNGIGLDINQQKVDATIERGYEALCLDVTQLDQHENIVSFSILSHFLEHLPGYRMARKCITAAMAASKDFVLIKQPWFDSDGYLFDHDLKFFWSDWRGHDFAMSRLELYRAIRDSGIGCRARFYGRRLVTSSNDLAIHPYSAPYDQHAYKEEIHGSKKIIDISIPTYYELQSVILLSDRYQFPDIEQHLNGGQNNMLFETIF